MEADMIVRRSEIVGYWDDDGTIICTECAGDSWDDATVEQIITIKHLEKADSNDEDYYCDECKRKLPVSPEKEEKEEVKRRWWVNLGAWDTDSGDEETDKLSKAVGKRIESEIEGVEYSTGDSAGLVFKTWDRAEAEAVREKAMHIMKEVWPECGLPEESFDITAQPQCPKCDALAKFSARFCDNCGSALI